MAIEDYYNQTVTKVSLSTGSWGTTATRTTREKFTAAVNTTPKESYTGDKRTVFYDAKFYCPSGQTVNHDDILVIGGNDYGVLSVKDTFNMNHHKRILLRRHE